MQASTVQLWAALAAGLLVITYLVGRRIAGLWDDLATGRPGFSREVVVNFGPVQAMLWLGLLHGTTTGLGAGAILAGLALGGLALLQAGPGAGLLSLLGGGLAGALGGAIPGALTGIVWGILHRRNLGPPALTGVLIATALATGLLLGAFINVPWAAATGAIAGAAVAWLLAPRLHPASST